MNSRGNFVLKPSHIFSLKGLVRRNANISALTVHNAKKIIWLYSVHRRTNKSLLN